MDEWVGEELVTEGVLTDPEAGTLADAIIAQHSSDPDLAGRAAGSFAWALAGVVLLQIGTFATYVIASRYLGPADIGVVGKLLTVVFWVDVLLDLGMGAALIYEQEEGQSRRVDIAFTLNSSVTVVVAVAVFLGAPAIAGFFNASSDVALFRALALLVLAKGLNQVPDSLLRRNLDFKRRLGCDAVRALGRFGVATTLLVMGWGPAAMIVGVISAEWGASIVTWILVRFRPRFAFESGPAAEMLRYGLTVFASRLVGMLWLNGDYLVIANRLGDSRAYGEYYTAFRLPELILGYGYNIVSSVAFPTFSAAREAGAEKLRSASLRMLRLITLFGFSAGVGMALIARDFILTVFGPQFSGAILPMELLCIAGAFGSIGMASGDLFNAIGKPRLGLYFNLIGAPILIVGLLLVVHNGIVWVAAVHLIVIVPYSMFRIGVANRLVGTTWRQSFGALRAAFCASLGLLALGLPVRMLVDSGFGTGLLIGVAGVIGAGVGVLVGDRSTVDEVSALVRSAIGR